MGRGFGDNASVLGVRCERCFCLKHIYIYIYIYIERERERERERESTLNSRILVIRTPK